MPDGFGFHVTFGTGETFTNRSRMGDAVGFREACEAVMAVAAGKDEAEISQLLVGELRSRDIVLYPSFIGILAAAIADGDASITFCDWVESDGLPDAPRPGLLGSLAGKVIGRIFAPPIKEVMGEAVAASPVLSRLMRPAPPDPRRYVPEVGQEPTAAEVITEPDLAERVPWLLNPPPEGLPGTPRSARGTFSFEALLEEESDVVIVRAFSERIGRLNPHDAEAYAAHIRSARLRDQFVAATATCRITGRRSLRVTVRLERGYCD
jgi:hypothetical protein